MPHYPNAGPYGPIGDCVNARTAYALADQLDNAEQQLELWHRANGQQAADIGRLNQLVLKVQAERNEARQADADSRAHLAEFRRRLADAEQVNRIISQNLDVARERAARADVAARNTYTERNGVISGLAEEVRLLRRQLGLDATDDPDDCCDDAVDDAVVAPPTGAELESIGDMLRHILAHVHALTSAHFGGAGCH